MTRSEQAIKLFESGYNCSQSIVLAFKDILNVDENTLKSISSSFGGGVSRLREICGCISGMGIVFGLLYGNYDVNDPIKKGEYYNLIQQTSMKFKQEYKSYLCDELLNIKEKPSNPFNCARNENYYKERPCSKYIGLMAKIMESEIDSHGKN